MADTAQIGGVQLAGTALDPLAGAARYRGGKSIGCDAGDNHAGQRVVHLMSDGTLLPNHDFRPCTGDLRPININDVGSSCQVMLMYAVVVIFRIKSDWLAEFLPLVLQNARTSLSQEPDCHQFDVATDPERPDEVFLYELYADRAAFDHHMAAAHFCAFDAEVSDMIATKEVLTYSEVAQ